VGLAERALEQVTEATQEFVGRSRVVEVAFNGSARNLWLASGVLGLLFGRPRILAVTDTDLQLLDVATGKSWVRVRPKSVLATYPRSTTLGPPKGLLSHKVRLPDGQRIYLHRMYFDQIRRVDGEADEA
jgi:hypothetical protein